MKHHVMLTVVAIVSAVAFTSRASAQAAATPSAGPIVVHAPGISWADGPPSLPRGAQFALLEGNPAEAVPLTLRLKFPPRSEEHTSELQSQSNLVCRLLLEKKERAGARPQGQFRPSRQAPGHPPDPVRHGRSDR